MFVKTTSYLFAGDLAYTFHIEFIRFTRLNLGPQPSRHTSKTLLPGQF